MRANRPRSFCVFRYPQVHACCKPCQNHVAHDPLHVLSLLAKPGVSERPATWHSGRCSYRSEEHTSELQSLRQLVCRLLLENKPWENTGRIEDCLLCPICAVLSLALWR